MKNIRKMPGKFAILFLIFFISPFLCCKAQDKSVLLKCIDSSSVKHNSQRSSVYAARLCAGGFRDDFFEKYSNFSSLMGFIEKADVENAVMEAALVSGLNDEERLLLLARISVLRLDVEGAENYYSLLAELENYEKFSTLTEFVRFCIYNGDTQKAEEYSQKVMKIALDNDQKQRAFVLSAVVNYYLGHDSKAEEEIFKAGEIKNSKQDKKLKAEIFFIKGLICAQEAKFDSALTFYKKALDIFDKIQDGYFFSQIILLDRVKIHLARLEYDLAVQNLKKAVEYAQIIPDETDKNVFLSKVYLKWGEVEKNYGNYAMSREKLNLSLSLAMENVKKNPNYASDLADVEALQASLEIQMKNFPRAQKLCEEALNIYSDKSFSNSPGALEGKAGVLNTYGNIFEETSLYWEAKRKYDESLENYALLTKICHKKYDFQRALVLNNLGYLYDRGNNFDDAVTCYKTSAMILKKLSCVDRSVLVTYAKILTNIGNLYRKFSKTDSSMKYLQEALNIFAAKKTFTDPESAEYSSLCNNLAILYKNNNDYDNAEVYYTKSYKIREELIKKSNLYIDLWADILNNYGMFYAELGDADMAVFYLEQSLEIRKDQAKSKNPKYQNLLADNYDNLAYAALQNGNTEEATEYYQLSHQERKAIVSQNPELFLESFCTTLFNLSSVYNNEKKHIEALDVLLELKEVYLNLVGVQNLEYYYQTALIDYNIAMTYGILGNTLEAYTIMKKAESEFSSANALGSDNYLLDLTDALNQLGNYASDLSIWQEAEKYYEQALEIRTSLSEKKLISYYYPASTLNNLGLMYFKNSDVKNAQDCYFKARKLFELVPQENYNIETVLAIAMTNINIVQCYIYEKNSGNSENFYDLCVEYLNRNTELLQPYLYNGSAGYYYEYSLKLLENLTE